MKKPDGGQGKPNAEGLGGDLNISFYIQMQRRKKANCPAAMQSALIGMDAARR